MRAHTDPLTEQLTEQHMARATLFLLGCLNLATLVTEGSSVALFQAEERLPMESGVRSETTKSTKC